MVDNDVTKEHPSRKPAPWIENAVFYLKPDEILRKTQTWIMLYNMQIWILNVPFES